MYVEREIEYLQQQYNNLENEMIKVLNENEELKLCIRRLASSINVIVR